VIQATRNCACLALLITNVVMPEFNGRVLAEILTTARPEMKTLYTSGYTQDACVEQGELEPGCPLLDKPFTRDALARRSTRAPRFTDVVMRPSWPCSAPLGSILLRDSAHEDDCGSLGGKACRPSIPTRRQLSARWSRSFSNSRARNDFLDIVKGNGYSSVLSGAMFSFFILE
jgi:hypothetical protein